MSSITQILLDSVTPGLVIVMGLFTYRKLPGFYRVLFFQTLIFLMFDLYATTFPYNTLVYNIAILIEIGLLFLSVHLYFNSPTSRWIVLATYLTYLLLWCLDLYVYGKSELARHAYIFAGLSLTAMFATILFHHFNHRKSHSGSASLVVLCLSIFIFFAGTVPYLSMMYYIQALDPKFNKTLFQYMMLLPAVIRYFLVALAFFLFDRSSNPLFHKTIS